MKIKVEINSILFLITKIKTDKQTDEQGGQKNPNGRGKHQILATRAEWKLILLPTQGLKFLIKCGINRVQALNRLITKVRFHKGVVPQGKWLCRFVCTLNCNCYQTWPIKGRILAKIFNKSMARYFRYPFVSTNFPSFAALILRL